MNFRIIDSDAVIVDLLAEVFDEAKGLDGNFVRWMGDCPTGPNRWYAAFDGDRPVSVCGMLPVVVEVDDRRCAGAICNSCGTVERYRRRGAFTALSRHALDDMRPDVAIEVHNAAVISSDSSSGWRKRGVLEMLGGRTTEARREVKRYDSWNFRYFPTYRCMPMNGHPRFMVVRGESFMKWRYSKPGQVYRQNVYMDDRYVIWKERGGRKQVLETNDWETAANLGGDVDVWQFKGAKVANYLKGIGFKLIFERDFMLRTNLKVCSDLDAFRFELCDYEVF